MRDEHQLRVEQDPLGESRARLSGDQERDREGPVLAGPGCRSRCCDRPLTMSIIWERVIWRVTLSARSVSSTGRRALE